MKALLIIIFATILSLNLFGQTMTIHLKNGEKAEYSIRDIDRITYSNGEYSTSQNSFIDPRDGQKYRTVRIGSQVWMAENLNYDSGKGSYCYDNNSSNCSRYGRLYTENTANNVAPSGWHLPSKREFEQLINYLGGNITAYSKIIEGGSSGFDALFTGIRDYPGNFGSINEGTRFWLSTPAWSVGISSLYKDIRWGKDADPICANRGFPVRCIKD
jgi:uncharacterized protein (TIGR02145 family)